MTTHSQYLPFAQGSWRMSMGLKPLRLEDWIEIDDHLTHELALKHHLLQTRYTHVFASMSGSETAQQEALNILLEHLTGHFPAHYQIENGAIAHSLTGDRWLLSDFADRPLDLAGRLVQDDLCLMLPGPEGYILGAGSVCFPSRWSLQEKIGKPMAQIHHPVPGYDTALQRPVNNFFDHLRVDCPSWRLNWSIVDTPDLALPPDYRNHRHQDIITGENAGDKLWVRVERQTLRRLPLSNAILFGIHTYVYPLKMLESKSEARHGLASAIQQMPIEMQHYKNLIPIRTALLDYLRR
jgi:hypothetical protein